MGIFLRRTAALLLAGFLMLFSLVSCGSTSFTLTVLLQTEGNCSAETVRKAVPYGADVSFALQMPEGETVIQILKDGVPAEDASYRDGVLTLSRVRAPHTLRVVTGNPESETFYGVDTNNKLGGNAECNVPEGRVAKGTLVTFRATPRDQAVFLGWSMRKPLSNGGTLVSVQEQLTMSIESNTFLYANYDCSGIEIPVRPVPQSSGKNRLMVYYHANGGSLSDGRAALETEFDLGYWQMPNARQDDGTFTRDGYVLLGYSDQPDGSTGIIPPGHRFVLPEDGIKRMTLYCIWQKAADASDLMIKETGNGVTVERYLGTETEVYLPRTIRGKPVTTLAEGCFSGTDITFVSIPPTVRTVEPGAFSDCRSLRAVTVYDTLQSVQDSSFSGAPVHTLRICAATPPKYMTGQSFAKKYERLVLTQGVPRVVTVSGSSKHAGLDTEYLEKLLGGSVTVVNFGTNAMMNIVFFLEGVCHYLGETDYLVYAPEQYGPYAEATNGNPKFPSNTYQGIEACYNLMELADISHYEDIFSAFSAYCTERARMKDQSYSDHNGNFDVFGQFAVPRPNLNSEDFAFGANGIFRFDETVIPEEFRGNMNRVLDLAAASGAVVFFSHPPMNRNNIRPDHLNSEHYDAYNRFLSETVHAAVISDVRDYILDGKYFYDTDYHPNEPGRALHTEALARDLLAAGVSADQT